MAIRREGASVLGALSEFLGGKVCVELSGPVVANIEAKLVVRLLITHVMISQAHAVADFPIQNRHGFLGDGPFLGDRVHDRRKGVPVAAEVRNEHLDLAAGQAPTYLADALGENKGAAVGKASFVWWFR